MNNYYSQQGEDVYINNNYINKKVNKGIYLELGACDGVTLSNTKFFQEKYDFSGILIEPVKKFFEKLLKNRPNNLLFNYAIDYKKGTTNFIGDSFTAGLSNTMESSFKDFHHSQNSNYLVESLPIRDIIKKSKIEYIDLMSIDVEGGELVVLETMDWTIPIYIIIIELDNRNEKKDNQCRDLLKEKGFTFDRILGSNDIWINKNYFRREELFDSSIPKFKNLQDAGIHIYLEKHLIDEVENSLR